MTSVIPPGAGFYLDEYDGPTFWRNVNYSGGTDHDSDPLATARGECWIWTGSMSAKGYGRIEFGGRQFYAHRLAHLDHAGKIPQGTELDHKCRNHGCVKPSHLESVTRRENIARGLTMLANRDTCRNGHAVNPDAITRNGNGHAVCVACANERRIRERAKAKASR